MIYETKEQIVRQILEICEMYNMPKEIKALVKNKCWKLTRDSEAEKDKENDYKNNNR